MILEKRAFIFTGFDDEIVRLYFGIKIGIAELWDLSTDDSRASWSRRSIGKCSLYGDFESRIISVFIREHEGRHRGRSALSMRARDSDTLLRIEDFTECDGIGDVTDMEISCFREFRICINLFRWSEIWLRDDRLRVDDERGIVWQMGCIMSDRDSESLFSERIEKW